MSKKMPIFVLILLFVIFLPFILMITQINQHPELKKSNTDIISEYSSTYEKQLTNLGYDSEIITENGKKLLAVYSNDITFKFSSLDACTAEFGNKSLSGSKYKGEMSTSNIGVDTIKVTVVETYQGTEFKYSCSYDPSGFDTLVAETSNYEKNDIKIKQIMNGEYTLTSIYAQMQSIHNNMSAIVASSSSSSQ